MRKIKLFAGLTGEYEIIETDAPTTIIETQLRINNHLNDFNITIENPYGYIEECGYSVNCIGCHYDFDDETPTVDVELDSYDFNDFEKESW